MNLKVLVFTEGGKWIAQVLEHDLCVAHKDPRLLMLMLTVSLAKNYKLNDSSLDYLKPAPKSYWNLWLGTTEAVTVPASFLKEHPIEDLVLECRRA